MREILFRGKKVDSDEWIEGSFIQAKDFEDGRLICFIAPFSEFYTDMKEVIPESISEFTGLTDKNGKKIFEGDVVQHNMIKEFVIFADGSFGLFSNGSAIHLMTANKRIEVIGNIHDNPELLGSAE